MCGSRFTLPIARQKAKLDINSLVTVGRLSPLSCSRGLSWANGWSYGEIAAALEADTFWLERRPVIEAFLTSVPAAYQR